jgi:hypothetical protein
MAPPQQQQAPPPVNAITTAIMGNNGHTSTLALGCPTATIITLTAATVQLQPEQHGGTTTSESIGRH